MLTLAGATRRYTLGEVEVTALDRVDLTVAEGEFVAIVGPSGSGKSTLLNLIGMLDKPTEGKVLLNGRDITNLNEAERTRLRLEAIGFVFQRFHLVSIFSALENVALPMEALGMTADERFDRARELLNSVGMGDRLHFTPNRLSGGQRQRVAICRALANQPRIVLADEPTGELHSDDKKQIIDLFLKLNEQGQTFVVVTHDLEMAAAARRQIEIRDGRIAKQVVR